MAIMAVVWVAAVVWAATKPYTGLGRILRHHKTQTIFWRGTTRRAKNLFQNHFKETPMHRANHRTDKIILGSIVALQSAFSAFFIFDLAADIFGLRKAPMSWEYHEIVQIITIIALLLGSILGMIAFRSLARQRREIDRKILVARQAFNELIDQSFVDWGLTPSEKDVALFVIKGLSNAEIAEMRGKSIGTIKAQVNAVFKKAGASGRSQLISLFMEELLAD